MQLKHDMISSNDTNNLQRSNTMWPFKRKSNTPILSKVYMIPKSKTLKCIKLIETYRQLRSDESFYLLWNEIYKWIPALNPNKDYHWHKPTATIIQIREGHREDWESGLRIGEVN